MYPDAFWWNGEKVPHKLADSLSDRQTNIHKAYNIYWRTITNGRAKKAAQNRQCGRYMYVGVRVHCWHYGNPFVAVSGSERVTCTPFAGGVKLACKCFKLIKWHARSHHTSPTAAKSLHTPHHTPTHLMFLRLRCERIAGQH